MEALVTEKTTEDLLPTTEMAESALL